MSRELAELIRDSADEISGPAKRTKFIKEQYEKLSDEQQIRFEFFVRSHFLRQHIKSVMNRTLKYSSSSDISDDMAIAVGGLAKLFVGELVETATSVLKEDGEDKPLGLRRRHIIEAHRRMIRDSIIESHGGDNGLSFLFGSYERPLAMLVDHVDDDFLETSRGDETL